MKGTETKEEKIYYLTIMRNEAKKLNYPLSVNYINRINNLVQEITSETDNDFDKEYKIIDHEIFMHFMANSRGNHYCAPAHGIINITSCMKMYAEYLLQTQNVEIGDHTKLLHMFVNNCYRDSLLTEYKNLIENIIDSLGDNYFFTKKTIEKLKEYDILNICCDYINMDSENKCLNIYDFIDYQYNKSAKANKNATKTSNEIYDSFIVNLNDIDNIDNLNDNQILELKNKLKEIENKLKEKSKPKTITISGEAHNVIKEYCINNNYTIGEWVEKSLLSQVQ